MGLFWPGLPRALSGGWGALRSSFSSWFFPTQSPMTIYFLYSCFSLGLLVYYEVRRLILKTKGKIRPHTYSIFHVPLFTLKNEKKARDKRPLDQVMGTAASDCLIQHTLLPAHAEFLISLLSLFFFRLPSRKSGLKFHQKIGGLPCGLLC